MTKAKGNALQGFDGTVTVLGESIGVRAVKSVENIRLPVFEHPSASGEFGKLKAVVGVKPFREQFRSRGVAFCVHKFGRKDPSERKPGKASRRNGASRPQRPCLPRRARLAMQSAAFRSV